MDKDKRESVYHPNLDGPAEPIGVAMGHGDPAPLSACLRIMAARLSLVMSPAEKREIEQAAALLETATPSATVQAIGEVIGQKEMGLALVQWCDKGLRPIGTKVYGRAPSETAHTWHADLLNLWAEYTGGHIGGSEFNDMVCDLIVENIVPTDSGVNRG